MHVENFKMQNHLFVQYCKKYVSKTPALMTSLLDEMTSDVMSKHVPRNSI